jgi:hypothetical protein
MTDILDKNAKPLGRKAYGSIPHLPGSRLGPGDHHCHDGQEAICLTKVRDRHDTVIVTEKLDGSNVAVANVAGEIVALGRAGYRAYSSPYLQHQYFAVWVSRNLARFYEILETGESLHGEWLAQAHGTRYELTHEPFVAFDLMRNGKRLPYDVLVSRCTRAGIVLPKLLSIGPAISVETVLKTLEPSGHGALDPVEGAVWRVERKGQFDFMAKWVRPDKVDGKFLPEVSGGEAIWHWKP